MQAICLSSPGGPENLYIGEWETPNIGPKEVLVKVGATALNRADILQREGKYPPPKGSSPILGLEMAGEIVEVGSQVQRWQKGDRVMALLSGGGYAQYAAVHEHMAMPVPSEWDITKAAAIPEVFLTAYQALDWLADLQIGESVLIHAGASGVGTAAIQLAVQKGAKVFITASALKHQLCYDLGASNCIDYKTEDFASSIQELTDGKGVNVIIDFLAAPYFQSNLNSLQRDGRLIMLALMGGIMADQVNLTSILTKRIQIIGSTLRSRNLSYKIALTQAFCDFAMPRLSDNRLRPVIDTVFDWIDVAEAHRYMEANRNAGKIILKVS